MSEARCIMFFNNDLMTVAIRFLKLIAIVLIFFAAADYSHAQITSYPYLEDFESGPGGWTVQSSSASSWELGTPIAPIINSAASGVNAWVTDLDDLYLSNENGYLQSPAFDFSTLINPQVRFKLWWSCEYSWDGAVFQSSVDNGQSWQTVGSLSSGVNWYNYDLIDSNPGGSGVGWTGSDLDGNGSNGWVEVSHPLDDLYFLPNVLFRLVFASDGIIEQEGIGFDDFEIYNKPCDIAGNPGTFDICGETVIDLDDYLSPEASPGGSWSADPSGPSLPIQPGNLVDFTGATFDTYVFQYFVGGGGACSIDSTFITINYNPPLTLLSGAQNVAFLYDNEGYVPDIELYLANHGGATVSDNCGEISWSVETLSFGVVSQEIVYSFTFTATDPLGSQVTSSAQVTIFNTGLFTEPIYGAGDVVCEDSYDLDNILIEQNSQGTFYLSLYNSDVLSYSFTQYAENENGGPPGATFESTLVDFPDSGAGSYAYTFKVDTQKQLGIYNPDTEQVDYQVFSDTTDLTVQDKKVPFNAGEDKVLCLSPGEPAPTISDLTAALDLFPDPNDPNTEPQGDFDPDNYWTPSTYIGPGVYTFDASQPFIDCFVFPEDTELAIATVSVVLAEVGSSTTLVVCEGSNISEQVMLDALGAEDGGEWNPAVDPDWNPPQTYEYSFPGCPSAGTSVIEVVEQPNLLNIQVYLQGALIDPNTGEENLMRDDLRVLGYIPTNSPYDAFSSCDPAVFNTTGPDAIVDWVWLEFRNPDDNTQVIEGISALLQRDGDVVDLDGISPIYSFMTSDYYLVVSHRNHSAVMSNQPVILDCEGPVAIDFTSSGFSTFGSHAQYEISPGITVLWAGKSEGNTIRFSGPDNDVNVIKDYILADPANAFNSVTFTSTGYLDADINMDGNIRFSGSNNDSNVIKDNVLGHPGNGFNSPTYEIQNSVPDSNN